MYLCQTAVGIKSVSKSGVNLLQLAIMDGLHEFSHLIWVNVGWTSLKNSELSQALTTSPGWGQSSDGESAQHVYKSSSITWLIWLTGSVPIKLWWWSGLLKSRLSQASTDQVSVVARSLLKLNENFHASRENRSISTRLNIPNKRTDGQHRENTMT